ncbi:hypothetical protein EMIT0P74_10145 [Pseudomonas sp. IT-P74]
MALCHSTATGQWLAAHKTSIPALRAPVDHPPRPANKSIAVGMGRPMPGHARAVEWMGFSYSRVVTDGGAYGMVGISRAVRSGLA